MGWKGNNWEDPEQNRGAGQASQGVPRVVRAGQGACLHGRREGDSKPAHAKPAYAAAKIPPRACRPPVVEGKFKNRTLCKMRKEGGARLYFAGAPVYNVYLTKGG